MVVPSIAARSLWLEAHQSTEHRPRPHHAYPTNSCDQWTNARKSHYWLAQNPFMIQPKSQPVIKSAAGGRKNEQERVFSDWPNAYQITHVF